MTSLIAWKFLKDITLVFMSFPITGLRYPDDPDYISSLCINFNGLLSDVSKVS